LERPLDFTAVTHHSEFLGEVSNCITPGALGYDSMGCQQFRAGSSSSYAALGVQMIVPTPKHNPDICGAARTGCSGPAADAWERIQAAAAAAYDHCNFTSFVAYEYSRSAGGSTMHRNVIFRTANVPSPVTAFDAPAPQGLWRALKATCIDAG